jgi:thiamine monophosphate synthase
MKEMISLSTVPAVAIGGITLDTLPEVLAAGASNFCMVRPLNQTSEPEKVLKEILRVYEDCNCSGALPVGFDRLSQRCVH